MFDTIIGIVFLAMAAVLYVCMRAAESNTFISDRRKRYIKPPAAYKKTH